MNNTFEFIYNGKVGTAPKNWEGLTIEATFDGDQQAPRVSFDEELEFIDETFALLKQWAEDGITGAGPGVTEGVPLDIRNTCQGLTPETLLKAVIDLGAAEEHLSYIKAPVKERAGLDFINDIASAFTIQFLTTLPDGAAGKITAADYVKINYVKGQYPQALDIVITGIAIYEIFKELADIVHKIYNFFVEEPSALTATGFSGFLGAIAYAILEAVAIVVEVTLEIVELAALVNRLFELLFPFVYYHLGMKLVMIWKRGFEYLGYTTESTIWDDIDVKMLAVMPPKNVIGSKVGLATEEDGLYLINFADFIRKMEMLFNAKLRVFGKVVKFEIEENYDEDSGVTLPDEFICSKKYNTPEWVSNYEIRYQIDSQDYWSMNAPKGLNYQVTVSQKLVNDKRNRLLQNITEIDLDFSLSYVKTEVSELESIMTDVYDGYAQVVNAVGSIFGDGDLVDPIPQDGQKDCLQLDTHFTSRPRLVLVLDDSGRVDSNFAAKFGSKALYKKYHYTKSPVPQTGNLKGNQYTRYEMQGVSLCCDDFYKLLNKNKATWQGKKVRVRRLKFVPYLGTADIHFEINEIRSNNLMETAVEDGGIF